MKYDIVNPQEWREFTARSPYSSPFHEYEWNEMVAEQFGASFEPVVAEDSGREWLLPIYRNLPWLRKNEVQAYCIGYGGPLPADQVTDGSAELTKSLQLIETFMSSIGSPALRATLYPATFWPDKEPGGTQVKYGSTCKVMVKDDADSVFAQIPSGRRTAVRKSVKSGVTIRELRYGDEADMNAALDLLNQTQENVGSTYRTSGPLFKAINELRGSAVKSATFVAELGELLVGMALCVHNDKELFHLFHGWNRDYANTRANQALIWRMLNHASERQVSLFNMGESHTAGIQESKMRWGGHIEYVPKILLRA